MWVHGRFLRFVTAGPTKITIWEVEFTLGTIPVEVETLSFPDNINHMARFEFLPASHQAVFAYPNQIFVWDGQNSEVLLHHTGANFHPPMAFSSNGHFLACSATGLGIFLWRDSPTGYKLHGKLPSSSQYISPLLSPDGKSGITFGGSMVQLWHTSNFSTTSSNTSTPGPKQTENFILDFLLDRSLATATRQGDNTVMVLDLMSGNPQLTIETSMEVYGLRLTNNNIVAIGCEKVIIWNLPAENPLPDTILSIEDSIQTIYLCSEQRSYVTAASMSLDFHHIALVGEWGLTSDPGSPTQQHLGGTIGNLWFTPGGDIWCPVGENRAEVWTITSNDLSCKMVVDDIEDGSWGCPWGSSHGYKVTDDGWVLNVDGKRLLMLPPPWQSSVVQRVWNGRFLALLHASLPEPVIIDLEL